ncbi:MAG: hypothetical protein HZB91_03920 [Elusimicrobia bacterium]|nr:hypothetical protein [Elusimicrobiota bacterium]
MRPRVNIDPKLVEEIVAELKEAFGPAETKPEHPPEPAPPPKHAAPKTPTIPPKHAAPKTPTVPPKHPAPKTPTIPPKHAAPKTPTIPPKHAAPKTPTIPPKHALPAEPATPLRTYIVPAFPPEVPLSDGRPEDLRKIAVFYTAQFAVPIGVVVGYLQDIGRKIGNNPLMIAKVLVERVIASTNPRIAAGKAKTAKAAAVIAILHDLPAETIKIWDVAMASERLNFHLLTPEQAADRSVLIDIMSGLLLLDPNTRDDDYKWDGQGDKSGIRRNIR